MRSNLASTRLFAPLFFLCLSFVMVLSFMSVGAMESKHRLAPSDNQTLIPTKDSYVSANFPDTNYGESDVMHVDQGEFGQEDFALVAFNLASIPDGSTINSASLELYLANGGFQPEDLGVHRVTEVWLEDEVDWNNRPDTVCCEDTTNVGTTEGIFHAWDITALVQEWLDGVHPNYGVAVRGPSDGYYEKAFASREGDTPNRPLLIIDYTPPDTPTPTPDPASGSISGLVWRDKDADGSQDAGEEGLEGVRLDLIKDDELAPATVIDTVLTDADGNYAFTELEAGGYRVDVDPWTLVPHANVLVSGSEPHTLVLDTGEERKDVNFGYDDRLEPFRVNAAMLTQGKVWDFNAGVAYDNIAGKDTLARVHLYSPGGSRSIKNAACEIWRGGEKMGEVAAEGMPLLVTAEGPSWGFSGAPTLDCWIPGEMLAMPDAAGDYVYYQVRLRIEPERGSNETIDLTAQPFLRTGDLSLLLVPWNELPGRDKSQDWEDDMTAAVPATMEEVQRIHPLRAGVGNAFDADTGLRYAFWPFAGNCPDDVDKCGVYARRQAANILRWMNARSGWEFDFHMVLSAASRVGGGQARYWKPCSISQWFTEYPASPTSSVAAHEVGHCLGQVRDDSPNVASGGSHAGNRLMPVWRGFPLVNLLDRRDISKPRSLMFPTVGRVGGIFFQGYEWNDVRKTLLKRARSRAALTLAERRFHLVGTIDREDNVTVDYSAQVVELPSTPVDPDSPYTIVFLDAVGQTLGEHPFAVTFEQTDGQNAESTTILETIPLPEDSVRVEIRKENQILYAQDFSEQSPTVTNVTATEITSKAIELEWSGDDKDSGTLMYNLYFQESSDAAMMPIDVGLTETNYQLDTGFAPATEDGRIIVEVSDGLHTAQEASNIITIDQKPPVVAISQPTTDTIPIAGQALALRGSAYDYTAGLLGDAALSWRSNRDGDLGTGSSLVTDLSAGSHILTLEATGPTGLTASTSLETTVLADGDGDGLPDDYEDNYECILSDHAADDLEDQDDDGLWPRREYEEGTDPCVADTDGDGANDGDEVKTGSDPLVAESVPLPQRISVTPESVEVASCPVGSIQEEELTVYADADLEWAVAANARWLEIDAGGVGSSALNVRILCAEIRGGGDFGGEVLLTAEGSQPVTVPITVHSEGGDLLFLPMVVR